MIVDLNPGDYFFPNATCIGVYDGDTIYLDVDSGRHVHWISRNREGELVDGYRLLDIDAPEIRPLVTRKAGTAARDYLMALVLAKSILVQTLQDPDNFGRYLVHIWLPDGTDVNAAMLASGHAIPYSR